MNRHAKAPSAGSTDAAGNSRGLRRRAVAARRASNGSKGSGAPTSLQGLLAVLALAIFALAAGAAPASAEPAAAKMGTVSNVSYASAHVTGKVRANSFATSWSFEYSTDDENWTSGPGGFYFGATDEQVAGDLTGLKGGTKYFVRLGVGFGEAVSPGPDPAFTTLPVDPPSVVSVDNASEVEYTTAKAKGKVSRPANADPAFDVECRFQYVTDAQFTATGFEGAAQTPCEGENPLHTAGTSDVEAHLTGLAGATTYHLRLFAANASPTTDSKVAASTFTTKAIPKPTVLATDNASAVEFTTAKVSGEVQRPGGASTDPGLDASCAFEYVTDAQFTATGFAGAAQAGCNHNPVTAADGPGVEAELTGLANATTYHLRLTAANAGGTDAKVAASTFTTKKIDKPTVLATDDASAVEFTTAKVSGEVQRPAGADPAIDASCVFEYVTDAQFTATGFAGATQVGCNHNPVTAADGPDVEAQIEGLTPATKYHLRLTASNTGGTDSKVAAATFTTKAIPKPTVLTVDNASAVKYSIAKLTGKVERPVGADPLLDAGCNFEIVTEAQFTATGFEGARQVGCNHNPVTAADGPDVEAQIEGLTPATKYHLRLTASNTGGTDSKVAAATFTTLGPVAPPVVSIDPVTNFSGATAELTGKVNPNGTDPVFRTFWTFECTPHCNTQPLGEGSQQIDADEVAHPVTVSVTGLEPNTSYQVKLVASNPGGKSESTPQLLKTDFAPTSVRTGYAGDVEADSATLSAQVNPHNSPATYRFEYGLDQSYGSAAPATAAELGEIDDSFHTVTEEIEGLLQGTVYHFRLSATNTDTGKTTHGVDRTFRTAPDSACPNEQRRAENGSLALPDCRAYELVSPLAKSGNSAGAASGGIKYSYARTDGDAVLYGVTGAVEGATRGIQPYVVSHRDGDRWRAVAAPPKGTQDTVSSLTRELVRGLTPSSDLSKVSWNGNGSWTADNPYTDAFDSAGYYLGDLESEAVTWLSRPTVPNPGPGPAETRMKHFTEGGSSPDLSTLYFAAVPALLPGEEERVANGTVATFEYTGGVLHPAGTLPDGKEPLAGSLPANTGATVPFGVETLSWNLEANGGAEVFRGQVSDDGSTMYFISRPAVSAPTELYVRRNGHSTLVSHDAAGHPAPSGITPVSTQGPVPGGTRLSEVRQNVYGSPDGTMAVFQSTDSLAAGAPSDGQLKSYRYDVNTNTVSYLPGVNGATVVASSDDGQRFLFSPPYPYEIGVGAPDGAYFPGAGGGIYVWDHGAIALVSPVGSWVSPARATSDGSRFVFAARGVPGFNANGQYPQAQVFRYDLGSEQLDCLSCPPDGVEATSASLGSTDNSEGGRPADFMSKDADRVFFSTVAALVPRDTNGLADVYEWTPAGVSLLSTGQGTEEFRFLSSSSSGDDVFFTTRAGLDPRDTDGVLDVYDARVGGGFAQAAAVSPCLGNEVCKGAPPAPPSQPTPGTNSPSRATPKFEVGAAKVAGNKLKVKVTPSAAGTVAASGKGVKSTRRSFRKAGAFQLVLPLTPSSRRALQRDHRLKLEVHLRFSPSDGSPSSADLELTVKG